MNDYIEGTLFLPKDGCSECSPCKWPLGN